MLSPGTPSSPTPREDFNDTLRNEKKMGNTVTSDKRKSSGRVVQFNDGSTLRLLNTGHMVHDRADGSKQQRNPDGKGITVPAQHTHTNNSSFQRLSTNSISPPFFDPHQIEANGTKIQHNPNGNVVVQQMDGTTITHVATGEKIYVYPDGTTKQVDVDGTGIILNKTGERTDFRFGGDAAFDADRLARDKLPLGESDENLSSEDGKAEFSSDDEGDLNFKRCLNCEK